MDGHAVGKGGEAGWKPNCGSQHRRTDAWGRDERFQIRVNQFPGLSLGTTERQSETIQDRLFAELECFLGYPRELETHRKFSHLSREIAYSWESRLLTGCLLSGNTANRLRSSQKPQGGSHPGRCFYEVTSLHEWLPPLQHLSRMFIANSL